MKVAIFGGAFDPIHVDHVNLVKNIVKWNMADEVWVMVAPDARWDKRTKVPAEDRLAMVRMAFRNVERVVVKMEKGEHRGSYRMLQGLVDENPENEYILVVGADNYNKIPTWKDWTEGGKTNGEKLMREFELIVWPRPNYDMPDPLEHKEKGYKGLFLPPREEWDNDKDGSSTEVRNRLANNEPVDDLLLPEVAAYVKEHKLYR